MVWYYDDADEWKYGSFRFLWPCIVSKVWREKNHQDATIRCLLLTSISTCFGHHYAHLQEIKESVTAFGVLFCNKRENVDISCDVFFCGVVCSKPSWDFAYTHEVPTRFTTHYPTKKDVKANIYVFPLVTEQYSKCSNGVLVLLKMGIMMPETCLDRSS